MSRFLIAILGAACILPAAPPHRPLSLAEALQAAVARAKAENSRSEVAASQLRVLEAANKWKVELRPSLGIFSFSNPALLAATLGSSLLMGKRNAPSHLTMEGARFDVLAADLAAERLRSRTEIETARAFFDLLEKQQIAQQLEQALAVKRAKERELEHLLRVSRVTAVDQVAFQQEVLEMEQQKIDVEMERRLASVQLASLTGRLDEADNLEVEDVKISGASLQAKLPPVEKMFESALLYRRESKLLRERIDGLREKAGLQKLVSVDSVSAGYSYLANGVSGLLNTTRPNMIGGHSGQSGINLTIPLRQTGEKAAERDLLIARMHALELEARIMENELRSELLSMRTVVQASMDRLQLASRRVELSRKKKEMVKVRADNGLGGFGLTAHAEEADLQAEAALVKASCARKNTLFTLMVVCGLQDEREELQQQVTGN
jgi:outer membrane protein TolC